MTDRCQLNLRLDGKRDLLEACKEVAAAEGLSLNAWVVKQLEQAVTATKSVQTPPTTSTEIVLDNILDIPLDKIKEEMPGKLRA